MENQNKSKRKLEGGREHGVGEGAMSSVSQTELEKENAGKIERESEKTKLNVSPINLVGATGQSMDCKDTKRRSEVEENEERVHPASEMPVKTQNIESVTASEGMRRKSDSEQGEGHIDSLQERKSLPENEESNGESSSTKLLEEWTKNNMQQGDSSDSSSDSDSDTDSECEWENATFVIIKPTKHSFGKRTVRNFETSVSRNKLTREKIQHVKKPVADTKDDREQPPSTSQRKKSFNLKRNVRKYKRKSSSLSAEASDFEDEEELEKIRKQSVSFFADGKFDSEDEMGSLGCENVIQNQDIQSGAGRLEREPKSAEEGEKATEQTAPKPKLGNDEEGSPSESQAEPVAEKKKGLKAKFGFFRRNSNSKSRSSPIQVAKDESDKKSEEIPSCSNQPDRPTASKNYNEREVGNEQKETSVVCGREEEVTRGRRRFRFRFWRRTRETSSEKRIKEQAKIEKAMQKAQKKKDKEEAKRKKKEEKERRPRGRLWRFFSRKRNEPTLTTGTETINSIPESSPVRSPSNADTDMSRVKQKPMEDNLPESQIAAESNEPGILQQPTCMSPPESKPVKSQESSTMAAVDRTDIDTQ